MGNKVVRKTLELLLDRAECEFDFKVIQWAIDDYLEQGYNVKDFIPKYNLKYQEFLKRECL